MMRLPRVFAGRPRAWMACGALALFGIAALAKLPTALRGLVPLPAAPSAPINWVAEPGHYPPALLAAPGPFSPVALHDLAATTGPDPFSTEPNSNQPTRTHRAAQYSEFEPSALSEQKSTLRRLPDVSPSDALESGETLAALSADRLAGFTAGLGQEQNATSSPSLSSSIAPDGPAFPELSGPPPSLGDLRLPESITTPSPAGAVPQDSPMLPDLESRTPSNPQVMLAVANRANELSRRGFALAQRGALYSARAEFVQALRLLSQALDAQRGDDFHSKSLAAGLAALEEADEFVPKGSQLEANLNVAAVVVPHQTPVLKHSAQVTPLVAVQTYYTYAQEQLAAAGGNEPAASAALYGLGRLCLAFAGESADARRLSGPQALTMHQAALLVDPRNYRAANELGVLLARYGQLQEAKRVLLAGISVSRQREAWHNLAVVHERLGETDLAKQARQEAQSLTGGANVPRESDSLVRWVEVKEFASSGSQADAAVPASVASGAVRSTASATSAAGKPGANGRSWK